MSVQLESSSGNLQILLIDAFFNVVQLFVDTSPIILKLDVECDCTRNALFHNDCMYLIHLIECLVAKHQPSLELIGELVPICRQLGLQALISQLKYHESVLLSFIRSNAYKTSLQFIAEEIPSTETKLSSKKRAHYRQCLDNCIQYYTSLFTILHDVLPLKAHERSMGTLVNSLLNELIESIISLEDISSLASSFLSQQLDHVSKELLNFIQQDKTSKWFKLREVNFVLKVCI